MDKLNSSIRSYLEIEEQNFSPIIAEDKKGDKQKIVNLHFIQIADGMVKYGYQIFPDKRLIVRYYSGAFSMEDFIKWTELTGHDSQYDPSFSVINDFRDAESNVKIREATDFIESFKKHKLLYGKRKSAFLTSNPNQTVFTMMLEMFRIDILISVKTFSNLLEATKWLGIPVSDLDSIANCIKKLKETV